MSLTFLQPLIETSGLTLIRDKSTILKDVSMELLSGDYTAIIGPNGGGKSTLIRMLLGLQKATSGTIKLFGTPIEKFKSWHLIGYVPQNVLEIDAHFPASVYEVVKMGRVNVKKGFFGFSKEDAFAIQESMEKLEVWNLKDRLIGSLSGGQRQRVLIARALASKPKLLILDEPNTGVDAVMQKAFYALLKQLNHDEKLTILFITHDIGVIADDIKNVICINQKILSCSTPQHILSCGTMSELYGMDAHLMHHHH